jgi:xanthine dehydrogenase large subunit
MRCAVDEAGQAIAAVEDDSHDSASSHVRGKSEFVGDRPRVHGELLCGLVTSPHARARIVRLDAARARAISGVACVVTAAEVHHNRWGSIIEDQPVIAGAEVNYFGETVAVVAAESKESLALGIAAVEVEYEQLPAIRSIDEARAAELFIGSERAIARGDVVAALTTAPRTLEGRLTIDGADHFYLESQAAIVYPRDGRQLEVHSSTQHPTETQHVVAHACGVAARDVVCIARRLGGAFGGKESQAAPVAAWAALVASMTGRAARLVLSKDEDMIVTGKRNPFHIEWRCGFDDRGVLLALDAQLFSDGGAYADLSTAIMERALTHCDNAYFIPAMRVRGRVCRTNVHPHTAFRGFGGPKGVALIESVIEAVADAIGRDALDVRRANCYRDGHDTTHYEQRVENNCLPTLFASLEESCNYRARREAIRRSNAEQPERIRGMSLTAVKFGISFTTRFMNQANALVNVHADGTVQVSTGAVEMGQGVNARIAALVAEEFGIPRASVRVMPTSTEKNANTSPTAASVGTDLNGAAAMDAARRIRVRMERLAARLATTPKEQWPSRTAALGSAPEVVCGEESLALAVCGIPFAQLACECIRNRVSICEYGTFITPHLTFNKLTGTGRAFRYFTQGVACSEVEVDTMTGEVKVRRVDILMDAGHPINRALDLGQVYGGFVQGMGWVTTEHLVYDERGKLLSHSPSTYKIPSVQDIPREWHVELLDNQGNAENIRGTKATGEPPLLLALSVWTAIRDAVQSSRRQRSRAGARASPVLGLAIPATPERILRALWPESFAAIESSARNG